jgi:1,5-anhydro-D-fructose reductase (1,5-anhydro-D-mannitol-forming)
VKLVIKLAVLSFWHVHGKDYAKQAMLHPETEVAAVWDEVPERGYEKASELGVPFYESLHDIWEIPHLDGVIVTVPTNMRNEVIMAAAQRGKHIFTEKMLVPPIQETIPILQTVSEKGSKLTFALTRLYHGYAAAIADILQRQWLGPLTFARVRVTHRGAVADTLPHHFYDLEMSIGGAMIDLGIHPLYLMRMILGMPDSVSAHFGHVMGRDTEDNAAVVMKYPGGIIGIAETALVNRSSPPMSIEIHGTEGSLYYGFAEGKLQIRSTALDGSGKQWREMDMPDNLATPFEQWIGHIRNNTTADENIQTSIDTARLAEAAYRSVKENRTVEL